MSCGFVSENKLAALVISKTACEVVVDHADRLHKGITDCRADELEAAFFEVFAHGIRLGACGGDVFEDFPTVSDRLALNELPEVSIERAEFLLNLQHGTGVRHGRFDFHSVADDAGILEQ